MGVTRVGNDGHGIIDHGVAIGNFWDERNGDDDFPNKIFACVVACSPVSSVGNKWC
jgi:hypothetical protein